MTVKRRNHGRSRKGRGHCGTRVRCDGCGCSPNKDKAIKRMGVRNMVDAAALRDVREASAYENYQLPKHYVKQSYCVSCAVHRKIVRGRSSEDRKIRENPRLARAREFKKVKTDN